MSSSVAGTSPCAVMAPRPRAESPDPPLQSLESFLEAPLLGPVAFGDRVGEGERQRIAVVGRGEAAPPHVVLARQQGWRPRHRSRSRPPSGRRRARCRRAGCQPSATPRGTLRQQAPTVRVSAKRECGAGGLRNTADIPVSPVCAKSRHSAASVVHTMAVRRPHYVNRVGQFHWTPPRVRCPTAGPANWRDP